VPYTWRKASCLSWLVLSSRMWAGNGQAAAGGRKLFASFFACVCCFALRLASISFLTAAGRTVVLSDARCATVTLFACART